MTGRRELEGQRERERKEERERRALPPTSRTHEYFVPKDGIDREVITADICRYLGNDALVRPGDYENPTTRQVQAGYFIKAYRNLTNAMIEDLKLDSARWETERRSAASGRPVNGTSSRDSSGFRTSNAQPAPQYITSRTHESRQYFGHSEGAPPPPVPSFSNNGPSGQQDRYDAGPQYQQQQPQQSYVQPHSGPYGQSGPTQGGYPIHSEPSREYAYVSGGNFAADPRPNGGRIPVTQGGQIPRGDVYSQPGPAQSYAPQDNRNAYNQYQSQVPVSQAQYPPPQSSDQYYARTSAQYDTPMDGYNNDPRPSYHESSPFSAGPSSSAPLNPSVTAGVPPVGRREHRDDRRRDDRNDRHSRRT